MVPSGGLLRTGIVRNHQPHSWKILTRGPQYSRYRPWVDISAFDSFLQECQTHYKTPKQVFTRISANVPRMGDCALPKQMPEIPYRMKGEHYVLPTANCSKYHHFSNKGRCQVLDFDSVSNVLTYWIPVWSSNRTIPVCSVIYRHPGYTGRLK